MNDVGRAPWRANGARTGGGSARGSALRRALLGAILTLALIAPLGLDGVLPASAGAATGPDPWAQTTVVKTYDGTGQGTPDGTFINAANGFAPGDDTPTDGVVASNDAVGYTVTTRIQGGPARTVQVLFELPASLTFDPVLNPALCTSSSLVTGTAVTVDGKPGCDYAVARGVGLTLSTNLTLLGGDTAGTAQYGQAVTVSTGLAGAVVHSTATSAEVTVVSAPTADLVLRPSTCTVNGSCGSLTAGTTTGYLEVRAEPLT